MLVNTGESMGAKTMFPDPRYRVNGFNICSRNQGVLFTSSKPRIKRVYCIIPVLVPDVA
jgi:hypothetical protein